MRPILILLFAACASPYGVVLPTGSAEIADNPRARKALRELSDDERDLVVGYMIRRVLNEEDMSRAVTIGEALEAQRRFELEMAERRAAELALTARVRAENAENVQEMRDSVIVTISKLQPVDKDIYNGRYQPSIEIDVAFQNTTTRDIAAVRGVFQFADSFNAPIKRVNLTFEGGIQAGQVSVWHGGLNINEFIREDMRLWYDAASVQATWEPTGVLFSDGTLLTVVE